MSQIFNAKGEVVPVTVLNADPVVVTQVKDGGKDGYKAIQVGFGERKESNISKAQKGHFKTLGNFAHTKEFRVKNGDITMKVGDKIDVGAFAAGDNVTVSSISKGKGFQGVVKRHGFGGGPRSHGQKHSEREPGSISGGVRNGGRVPKNMRMAGRMGGDRITVKNLTIVDVDKESNQILIGGAIPGRRGTVVEVLGM